MDTLVTWHQSLIGNRHCQIITNGKCTHAFPVKSKNLEMASDALEDFIDDVRVPSTLWTNGAKEHAGPQTPFKKSCNWNCINLHMIEPGKKNQNNGAQRERLVSSRRDGTGDS